MHATFRLALLINDRTVEEQKALLRMATRLNEPLEPVWATWRECDGEPLVRVS